MRVIWAKQPLASCVGLVAALAAVSGQQAEATRGGAALAGIVLDTAGHPIPLATIVSLGSDASAVSDDSGQFHVANLRPGADEISIVRLGYKPLAFVLVLPRDSTVFVRLVLHGLPVVAPVEVRARATHGGLQRVGFYHRARSARGAFVYPERIDSLSHSIKPSQYLRDVPGLEVLCPTGAGACTVRPRLPPDCLWLFVDGSFSDSQIDDVLTPGAIAALEIYTRPALVPIEFQGRLPPKRDRFTARAGCGALVVWTRARLDR